MNFDAQQLYELLPAIYRTRDAEQGGPLRALIGVIATQVAVLEEDLAQLHDDQFIETCAEWVVPYIGELVGYRQLYGLTSQVRSPRAEVANTIRLRRRKGTAVMLQELARDVTGWEAQIVEFFRRLATTQYMNHLRPEHLGTPDLRRWEPLEHLGGPFDDFAHTVDVRRATSGRGRYNIANVGLFLWRLRSYTVTGAPAFKLDDRRYLFSPLGNDTVLFNRSPMDASTNRPKPVQAPGPITRRMLDAYMQDYYGSGKAISIEGVPIELIVSCNLSDAPGGVWAHSPPDGKVAIDPELGRIAFATAPAVSPSVTYHYSFSADLGGGEYDRLDSLDLRLKPVASVPSQDASIQQALDTVAGGGAVELGQSGRYAQTPVIRVGLAEKSLELRAANQTRPAIVLSGELQASGAKGSEISLNGLLISGGVVRLVEAGNQEKVRRLQLQHCTLVPGIGLTPGGSPQQPDAPSLIVETADTVVEIDQCILGGLRVIQGAAEVRITNSIIDATRESGVAYAAPDGLSGGAPLRIENCTVIGKVHTVSLRLASNTIFLARPAPGDGWAAPVWSDRLQEGCVRFSYLPLNSRVPRRYRCQPAPDADESRVRPIFTSLRHGDAAYCQLSQRSAIEIRQGAEDGAEIGVFRQLYQPQRETNLRVRLAEYLRFGLEAGLIFES